MKVSVPEVNHELERGYISLAKVDCRCRCVSRKVGLIITIISLSERRRHGAGAVNNTSNLTQFPAIKLEVSAGGGGYGSLSSGEKPVIPGPTENVHIEM